VVIDSLKNSEEVQWEARIQAWSFKAAYVGNVDVAKITGLSKRGCQLHFDSTRTKMAELISKRY